MKYIFTKQKTLQQLE